MNFQSNCPDNMKNSIFKKKIFIDQQQLDIKWKKLQRRETFVNSQIPPYKVEFNYHKQEGFFEKNELNIHFGPFLHLPALVGDINDNYRDLNYLYGAYVISFRIIRPVRLEFFKEEKSITLKLQSYVNPTLEKPWIYMNNIFWNFFKI